MDTPEIPTPVEEIVPVAEIPAPEVAPLPDLRYEWQPTDENDRPLGGKQVIIYKTQDELFEKMRDRSVSLLRQLRKVTRDTQLGTPEVLPDDAERFQNVTEFASRDLSAEERFDIAQKITNPETFIDGRDQLIESAFGKKPADVTKTLNEMQKSLIQARATENYVEFTNASQGYYDSAENRSSITRWLIKRNLAPTVANFNLAFTTLTESGLIQEAPVVRQEPVPSAPVVEPVAPVESVVNAQPPVVDSPRISGDQQPQPKRHSLVPSSLNDRVSSGTGVQSPSGSSMTLADIDRLPADVYKQKLKDKDFVTHMNKLEEDALRRRQARANG